MNVQEVKKIAVKKNIKPGTMKKAELIQAIQRAEGNEECFDKGKQADCGQNACLWRDDCK